MPCSLFESTMEKKVDTPRGRLAAFRGIPGKKPARPGVRTCVAAVLVTCLLTWAGCKQQGGPPPQGAPEVAVLTVQPERVVLTTDLPGRTAAFLISEIRPQVNGLIQKRLFEEGAEVKAGDVLYQIDPAPFEAALASAKASLARAEAGLVAIRLRVDRYKGLLADKAISQQDYDDASAAMKQAEAEIAFCKAAVRTAEINLAYTRVTAPISGRIGKSSVTEGALVTAYQWRLQLFNSSILSTWMYPNRRPNCCACSAYGGWSSEPERYKPEQSEARHGGWRAVRVGGNTSVPGHYG